MTYTYAVLGAGRQGTAAAYDMARWGEAQCIILADRDLEIARRSAERVNRLAGVEIARPAQVGVTDPADLRRLLTGVDACLSAVPYYYNLEIARIAIQPGQACVTWAVTPISSTSSMPCIPRRSPLGSA